MGTLFAITSERSAREAQKLAKDIRELCEKHNNAVVAAALMAVTSCLPGDLIEQVCSTLALGSLNKKASPDVTQKEPA